MNTRRQPGSQAIKQSTNCITKYRVAVPMFNYQLTVYLWAQRWAEFQGHCNVAIYSIFKIITILAWNFEFRFLIFAFVRHPIRDQRLRRVPCTYYTCVHQTFKIETISNTSPGLGINHVSSINQSKKNIEGPLMAVALLWGVSLQSVVLPEGGQRRAFSCCLRGF